MPTTTKTISPELKNYLRSIGHKGGIKSSQHPNRKQLNKEAAEARWRKRLPEPKAIEGHILLSDEQRRENKLKGLAEWRKGNHRKMSAHWVVKRLIKQGKLKREPCEVCGNPKSHAHHDNHDKPLEIHWLCSIHHGEREAMLRREENP